MFFGISTITVPLLLGFFTSQVQANDQNKNIAQFAVCYSVKTIAEAHGTIVVTYLPEEMMSSSKQLSAVDFSEFDPNPRSFQLFPAYPNPFPCRLFSPNREIYLAAIK